MKKKTATTKTAESKKSAAESATPIETTPEAVLWYALDEYEQTIKSKSDLDETIAQQEADLKAMMRGASARDPSQVKRVNDLKLEIEISRANRDRLIERLDAIPGEIRSAEDNLADWILRTIEHKQGEARAALFKAVNPFFPGRRAAAWETADGLLAQTNFGLRIQEPLRALRSGSYKSRPGTLGAKDLMQLFRSVSSLDVFTEEVSEVRPTVRSVEQIERQELIEMLQDPEPFVQARLALATRTPEGSKPMFSREKCEQIIEGRLSLLLSRYPDVAPHEFARRELARLEPMRGSFIDAQVEEAVSTAKSRRMNPLSEAEEFSIASTARKQAENRFEQKVAALRKQTKEGAK